MRKIILLFVLFFSTILTSFGNELQLTQVPGFGIGNNKCILLHGDNTNGIKNKNSYYICINNHFTYAYGNIMIFTLEGQKIFDTGYYGGYGYDWDGMFNNASDLGIGVFEFGNGKYLIQIYAKTSTTINLTIFLNNGAITYLNRDIFYGIDNSFFIGNKFFIKNLNGFNNICIFEPYTNTNFGCFNELGEKTLQTIQNQNTYNVMGSYNYSPYYYVNANQNYNGKFWTLFGTHGTVIYYLYNDLTIEQGFTFTDGEILNFGNQIFGTFGTGTVRTFGTYGIYNGDTFFLSGSNVAGYLFGQTLNYFNISGKDININNLTLNGTMYGTGGVYKISYLKNNGYIATDDNNTLFGTGGIIEGGGCTGTGCTSGTGSNTGESGTGSLSGLFSFSINFGSGKINTNQNNCIPLNEQNQNNYLNGTGGIAFNLNQNYKFLSDWSFTIFSVDVGRWLSDIINSTLTGGLFYLFNFIFLLANLLFSPLFSSVVTFIPGQSYCFLNEIVTIPAKPTTSFLGENISGNTSLDYLVILLLVIFLLTLFFKKDKNV